MRTDRVISSIPRQETEATSSCPNNSNSQCPIESGDLKSVRKERKDENWVYPSPEMFWKAMDRKGTLPEHLKDFSNESTRTEMDWIVTIHNIVNEQCWQEICRWERFRQTDSKIKLQRFLGRPKDTSPRAWFRTTFLGYRRPFDRHDWYIRSEDPNEPPRRYIIDFYSGGEAASNTTTNSFHLDVRPALDSFEDFSLRFRKYLHDKKAELFFFINKS
jgi:cytochrome c heme-lyase